MLSLGKMSSYQPNDSDKLLCTRYWSIPEIIRRVRMYVVPKDMGKSSKINKVVKEFCKFIQRVKVVSILSKNCKYPRVDTPWEIPLTTKRFSRMSYYVIFLLFILTTNQTILSELIQWNIQADHRVARYICCSFLFHLNSSFCSQDN